MGVIADGVILKKYTVADYGKFVGKVVKECRAVEGKAADILDRVGDIYTCEVIAEVECIGADGLKAVGECELGKREAIAECVLLYLFDSVGNGV